MNNIKLSISIMAHPTRAKFFDYLRDKLGNVYVAIDDGCGLWQNCRNAWIGHDRNADYHVVIQDDAIIPDNFRELAVSAIQDAINKCGNPVALSFYFGNRQKFKKIADEGLKKGFVKRSQLNWGVAVCLPVNLIEKMIVHADAIDIPQDDARIKSFLLKNKIPVYYPMPSLIDHRIEEDSLVGDPARFRRAWHYVDRK